MVVRRAFRVPSDLTRLYRWENELSRGMGNGDCSVSGGNWGGKVVGWGILDWEIAARCDYR